MPAVFLYIVIALLTLGIGLLLYLVFGLKSKLEKPVDDTSLKVMMEWMKDIKSGTEATRESMQKSIDDSKEHINARLTKAAEYIGELKKEMGGLTQIGPDIRRLSETLASPKLRGNFGEEILENMLAQVLPRSGYQTQHRFSNGEVVDVAIVTGERLLPIDSKFSMENFRLMIEAKEEAAADNLRKAFLRDVKKRVDEVRKKYILPQEGTHDFALMFVPSEGVYQEVIQDVSTMDYARSKRVIPVGPNSLFVYLQSVLMSLRGLQINRVAQQILDLVSAIKQESDKVASILGTLTNHIKNAGNTMSSVNQDFGKLQQHIHSASELQLEDTKEEIPEKVGSPE